MSISEKSLHIDDAVLEDLRVRLARTRWPEQVEGAEWDYGSNTEYIRELCLWWQNDFDWKTWEEKLAQWPNFEARVDGVDINFWYVKSPEKDACPLLLLHGWPSSRLEFMNMIEDLSNPKSTGNASFDAFDLVIPDLPGFGFSSKPRERGWGVARMAAAFDTLMTRELGYDSYFVQGGDWGGMIAARMGALFSERVRALHTNYAFIPVPMIDELPEQDMEACRQQEAMDFMEGAYHLIQETKTDSVTLAQHDSPAGFAAWVVEKFRSWSDCAGDVEQVFSKDLLCANMMFYWATESVASAARIYWESFHDPQTHWGAPNPQISAPTAIARFPKDPFARPRSWVELHFNLVRWEEMERGGHFPGFEQPKLLAADIREALRPYR